jgi:WD40 repeat protein
MRKPVTTLIKPGATLTRSVVFSSDNRYLVTANRNGVVVVWDLEKDAQRYPPLRYTLEVSSASFSPDCRYLLTACFDDTVRIMDAETGRLSMPPLRHAGRVLGAAFAPDSRRVVTWSADKTVRMWDLAGAVSTTDILDHAAPLVRFAFSSDGHRLASLCSDGSVRVWRVGTTHLAAHHSVELRGKTPPVAFDPECRRLVTAHLAEACVWDLHSGRQLYKLEHKPSISDVDFSPRGDRIATVASDGTARVWEARTGELKRPHGPEN